MKYYSGVGSRETPRQVLVLLREAATELERRGYILRSGGADGADSAFEQGVQNKACKQIFLPWKRFNDNLSPLTEPTPEAVAIGAKFHPALKSLSPFEIDTASGKRRALLALMGRNVHQVLGPDLKTPSSFVLCWTADGSDGINPVTSNRTGGTGQAIRIAVAYKVPVFNLHREDHCDRIRKILPDMPVSF